MSDLFSEKEKSDPKVVLTQELASQVQEGSLSFEDFNRIAERMNLPIKDQPQLMEYILRPDIKKDSVQHGYISKNTSMGNYDEIENMIDSLYGQVVNDCIFMEQRGWVLPTLAKHFSSLEERFIDRSRAKNGETARLVLQQHLVLNKQTSSEEKGSILGKIRGR